MLIALRVAGAAALAVVAYQKVQERSPETASTGLRAVRELAAIVLVLVKAVEGVVDVLGGQQRVAASTASSGWGYGRPPYEDDFDDEDELR